MSEVKIRQWAWPHIRQFRTYIDIGAAAGDTADPFVNDFTSVICFEPNIQQSSQISQECEVYECALADHDHHIELMMPANSTNPEHASINSDRISQWSNPHVIGTVPCKTLDWFDFYQVDFIKIDVEQGELAVIKGGAQTIQAWQPTIMYENKRHENDSVSQLLASWGYDIIKHKSDCVAVYH